MQIDIQDFPLVRMDYSGVGQQGIEETLQIFEQCLQRKQAFVFLAGVRILTRIRTRMWQTGAPFLYG